MLLEKPRVFTTAGELPESAWEFVEDRPGDMRVFRYIGADPVQPTTIHSLSGQDIPVLPGMVYVNGMLLSVRKGIVHPRLPGDTEVNRGTVGVVIRQGEIVFDQSTPSR
jgi:hypothetical protein